MHTQRKLIVLFSVLFSLINQQAFATLTHYPLSYEWKTIQTLEDNLKNDFGSNNPFSQITATAYSLLLLQQKMHGTWLIAQEDELAKNLLTSQSLLDQIEDISEKLSLSTKSSEEKQTLLTQLLKVLSLSDQFIDELSPSFLRATGDDKNNQQQQPPQQWPPIIWPPQPPPKENVRWDKIMKYGGIACACGFTYMVLSSYFFDKKYN